MRLGQLANPRQHHRVHKADAQAGNDAAADVHVGVLAARLKSGAEDAKPCAGQYCSLASKLVTGPA